MCIRDRICTRITRLLIFSTVYICEYIYSHQRWVVDLRDKFNAIYLYHELYVSPMKVDVRWSWGTCRKILIWVLKLLRRLVSSSHSKTYSTKREMLMPQWGQIGRWVEWRVVCLFSEKTGWMRTTGWGFPWVRLIRCLGWKSYPLMTQAWGIDSEMRSARMDFVRSSLGVKSWVWVTWLRPMREARTCEYYLFSGKAGWMSAIEWGFPWVQPICWLGWRSYHLVTQAWGLEMRWERSEFVRSGLGLILGRWEASLQGFGFKASRT